MNILSKFKILEEHASYKYFDFDRFMDLRVLFIKNKPILKIWYKVYLKTYHWIKLRELVIDRCN